MLPKTPQPPTRPPKKNLDERRPGMEIAPAYIYDETGAHVAIGDDGEEDVDDAAGSLEVPGHLPTGGDAEDVDDAAGSLEVPSHLPIGDDAATLAIRAEAEAAEEPHLGDPMVGEAICEPIIGRSRGGPGASAPALGSAFAVSASATPVPISAAAEAMPAASSLEAEARADFENSAPAESQLAVLAETEAKLRDAGLAHLANEVGTALHRAMRSIGGPNNLRVLLRMKTLADKKRIQAARAEEKVALDKAAELKAKVKLAAERRMGAASCAKALSAQAKVEEEKSKRARLNFKQSEGDKKIAKEQFRRSFPTTLAKDIIRWLYTLKAGNAEIGRERRVALDTFVAKQKEKGVKLYMRVKASPVFWDPSQKQGLIQLAKKDAFGKYVGGVQVYATEALAWEVWAHKPVESIPLVEFKNFIKEVLPGYDALLEVRFPVAELLRTAQYNMDIAFLTAVWNYSSIVPEKLFPCGLRVWPLPG